MVKSLRTRILVWQMGLVTLIVAVFASLVYVQMRRLVFVDIDSELLRSAGALEDILSNFSGPPPNGPRPPQRNPRDLNPGPPPRPGRSLRAGDVPPGALRLPPPVMDRPELPGRLRRYFTVFDSQGVFIAGDAAHDQASLVVPRRKVEYRMRDQYREILMHGPGQTTILVGADARPQLDGLYGLAIALFVGAGAVLFCGGVASWWLSGRAVQPIQILGQTAQSISGENLDARMSDSEMDIEFQQLAGTLNSMLDRLEATIERQRQFTADASHELRTPIAVMLLQTEFALARARSAAEYQTSLSACHRAAVRLRDLAEKLLSISRLDARAEVIEKAPVDLFEIASGTVEELTPIANQKNVKLSANGEASLCLGDADQLRSLIANLVMNAIVHHRENGQVEVSVTRNGDVVRLCVRDDGPGIPEEHLPRLFDRFYRVDPSRSRQQGGSGLGLSICKQIVESHGGNLSVDSQVGHGSCFVATFPQTPMPNPETKRDQSEGDSTAS